MRALLLLTALLGLLLFLWPSQEAPATAPLEASAPAVASEPELEPTANLTEVRQEAPQDARIGWLVRVVDVTGDPVPGATVLTTFVAGRIRKRIVHTAGPGVRTDAAGEAFVPDPGDDLPAELLEDLADGSATARLSLDLLLSEKQEGAERSYADVSLDGVAPPTRVTLLQPSAGSVVIVVRSQEGPLPAGLTVDLVPARRQRILGGSRQLPVPAGHAEVPVRFDGIGLGLPIARELAAMHGGAVWIDSAPGQGARFRVLIPASAERGRMRPTLAPEQRQGRVLVVDDVVTTGATAASAAAEPNVPVTTRCSGMVAWVTMAIFSPLSRPACISKSAIAPKRLMAI